NNIRFNWIIFILLIGLLNLANINELHADETGEQSQFNLESYSPQTKKLCQTVAHISVPSQNQLDEASKASLKNCDALDLYYGFNAAPDYDKAFQCALMNKDYNVLVMAYANGRGVTFNPDLAMHFACMMEDAAPAEMDSRIAHLAQIKEGNKKTSFDICDDITSGYMMGWCSSIDQRLEDVKRNKKINDLVSQWTAQEQLLYQQVRKTAEVYIRDHSMNEIDLSGTARSAFAINAQLNLNQRLFELLQKVNRCETPLMTIKQYEEMDKQLNNIYKKLMADTSSFQYTTVTKEGIKKTEIAWIQYRDAWIQLARVKCPKISVESWQVLLIQDRIKLLNEILELAE
ncbi:TPA: lysozyme inhibitor LprI family protein, partial [Legionella pneumophila]